MEIYPKRIKSLRSVRFNPFHDELVTRCLRCFEIRRNIIYRIIMYTVLCADSHGNILLYNLFAKTSKSLKMHVPLYFYRASSDGIGYAN